MELLGRQFIYLGILQRETQNWLPKIAISFWKLVGQNHSRTGRYRYLDWCQHSLGPSMLITVIETQKSDLLKANHGKLQATCQICWLLFLYTKFHCPVAIHTMSLAACTLQDQ